MTVERSLILAIEREHGLLLRTSDEFQFGESRHATPVVDQLDRRWVLKATSATDSSASDLHRLTQIVASLRRDGYPAAEIVAAGVLDGWAYTLLERLPGQPLDLGIDGSPDVSTLDLVLDELIDLVGMHFGRGDLEDPPWPHWLFRTLEVGGEGYCIHETMTRGADTAAILEAVQRIAATCRAGPASDVVHFDLNFANILSDGRRITGIVDWSIPFTGAGQGDASFDLATLLFYAYDHRPSRDRLRRELESTASADATALYLAHLILRQVEWAVRHYPGQASEQRFLQIANEVLCDLGTH